jgi:hypothetical protein
MAVLYFLILESKKWEESGYFTDQCTKPALKILPQKLCAH